MFKGFFRSLRGKLFLWYVGSLLILITYFMLFIHYYTLPNSIFILALLFIALAVVQFVIIYKITHSLTYLSRKMSQISSNNLDERITDIKSKDEIGELATSFDDLMSRLNDAFQKERRFIGDVAHELKTPLATLKSSFEVVLSRDRIKEEYQKVIESAVTEADELSSTLNDVLDLAWFEAPNKQEIKKVNLTDLVGELVEIAQKLAAQKRINIEASIMPNIYTAGFKDKLARAILNIIENAIKYSPTGSKVVIILEKSPNKALINVTDRGVGIPAEELPHIFDRFYRGSRTDKVLGSGLGLAIAKSIVNLYQGEIKVKSFPGKGSSFIVILPLA